MAAAPAWHRATCAVPNDRRLALISARSIALRKQTVRMGRNSVLGVASQESSCIEFELWCPRLTSWPVSLEQVSHADRSVPRAPSQRRENHLVGAACPGSPAHQQGLAFGAI